MPSSLPVIHYKHDVTPEELQKISWHRAYAAVFRLQRRIINADAAGRVRHARRLTFLLQHSFYGRAVATRFKLLGEPTFSQEEGEFSW